MFRFAHIEFLWTLLIIPFFILIFIFTRIQRRKKLAKFGDRKSINILMPFASSGRPVFKFILLMLALAFFVIGTARPQFGAKMKTVKREGIELIIALDVSNSMMGEDIQPNRLERAKRAISRLIDRLKDDKIGLVVFAGDAYTQLPITSDFNSAKLFLNTIDTQIVPKQGTAIGAAINLASKSFTPQGESNKAIIVITDGENHEDDAIGAAKAAREEGIYVHTIGMGLPKGTPIPITRNGVKDYLKDKDGNVVITKLNEKMLEQIAASGDGIYVRANNAEIGLRTLFDEINKMEKQEMEARTYSEYNDIFQYFFGIGLLLLLLDFIILSRKNRYFRNIRLFSTENEQL